VIVSATTCSAASLDVEEPLAGTATESIDRWLLLEVTDAWAPKVLQTEALDETIRAKLSEWSATSRTRLQLVRRPGRTGQRPCLMVASSDGRISRAELDRYEDLLDIELDSLGSGSTGPIVLVCAHGRRDRCCATHGSAVYRALQRSDLEIWQTSHLGGHRFAACVLTLPDGLMFGRLRPHHADPFVEATEARRIFDIDLFRGRCRCDRPTQAAEVFLRRRLHEHAVDAISWLGTRAEGDRTWTATFRAPIGEESVRVRLEELDVRRPESCGAPPEPVTRFVQA
jgi:hypothetical protein